MISNARGKHSSPGVYMQEIEKTYATRSLGVTTLGVIGETLKGPAFEPVRISDWNEFQEYFGGTSTAKFKKTGMPKYELPYIAKSYLQESKQLEVCRVLGLSGYHAGPCWVICGYKASDKSVKYPIAILRSKGYYGLGSGSVSCGGDSSFDKLTYLVDTVSFSAIETVNSTFANCENKVEGNHDSALSVNNYGRFALGIKRHDETIQTVIVSLNPGESNYIVDVLGMSALEGNYDVFVEELYDMAHIQAVKQGLYDKCEMVKITKEKTYGDAEQNLKIHDYTDSYRYASTPWFVSQVLTHTETSAEVKKLFRFHTITDGNAANTAVKISISGILPEEGLFDVLVRDYNDSDTNPMVLERFSKCSMMPGTANFIGLKIGTYDGEYESKSKYVTVELSNNEMTYNCVPCGFLGYPMRPWHTYYISQDTTWKNLDVAYNTELLDNIKHARQYFGLSDITGVDSDLFTYKGKNAYHNLQHPEWGYSNGFHLDAILSYGKSNNNTNGDTATEPSTVPGEGSGNTPGNTPGDTPDDTPGVGDEPSTIPGDTSGETSTVPSDILPIGMDDYEVEFINSDTNFVVTVDGVVGYHFDTPSMTAGMDTGAESMPTIGSEATMAKTIYADKVVRKFTCYPYGGFDGWDIYREERTNTNNYRANKYKGVTNGEGAFGTTLFDAPYGLTGKYITSDYYAYLAGYKQFDNPNRVDINLIATPGIDYVNHSDLVNEVLDIVEENRQGDCLYIVTTPSTNTDGTILEPQAVVSNFDGADINSSYVATYYPWVKYYDAVDKKYINLPVTKDVVRNFAYTDNVLHPWFASAGMSRGNVDCVKACLFTKTADEDMLYESMINPVKTFGTDGVKIWGNKTMYSEDTPLNRINVRRLMIRIKKLILQAAQQLIFEQNDNTLEAQFRSIVDPILANAKQNRGISDYKIKVDNSAEARDRHELPARIWVKPINCLEYIDISFVVTPEGANFDE